MDNMNDSQLHRPNQGTCNESQEAELQTHPEWITITKTTA